MSKGTERGVEAGRAHGVQVTGTEGGGAWPGPCSSMSPPLSSAPRGLVHLELALGARPPRTNALPGAQLCGLSGTPQKRLARHWGAAPCPSMSRDGLAVGSTAPLPVPRGQKQVDASLGRPSTLHTGPDLGSRACPAGTPGEQGRQQRGTRAPPLGKRRELLDIARPPGTGRLRGLHRDSRCRWRMPCWTSTTWCMTRR